MILISKPAVADAIDILNQTRENNYLFTAIPANNRITGGPAKS